jgi:hypothetical protein
MRSIRMLAAALAVACVGMASARTARAAQPPSMQIEIASIAGTGCPPGSVVPYPFPDASGFQLTFLQYDIKTPDMLHKFCNVVTRVTYPAGWQFSVVNASYHGFASLAQGVDGIFASRYWFPGTESIGGETRLKSPFFGGFEQVDSFGVESWSPCGGKALLTIKTEAGLSVSGPESYMNVQDQDLQISYGCRWRACS